MWAGLALVVLCVWTCTGEIIAPPWVDTASNPCSRRSWQLLYWPMDAQCYFIFKRGPCRDSFQLTYNQETRTAECICPPNSKMWLGDGKCYRRYSQGPCDKKSYFDWDNRGPRCKSALPCPDGWLFWPEHRQCYKSLSQGPCLLGHLVFFNTTSKEPECGCSPSDMEEHFWPDTYSCYEHLTEGPCPKGHLFLYNDTKGHVDCSCNADMAPNYHPELDACYQLNSQGPCHDGRWYMLKRKGNVAECACKPLHVPWTDGKCYREYSQGPCSDVEFVFPNFSSCLPNPCGPTELYFPRQDQCFRVGTRGPCADGLLVIYEEHSQITYRGICDCSPELFQNYWKLDKKCYQTYTKGPCKENEVFVYNRTRESTQCQCDFKRGWAARSENDRCYKLFTQGPCDKSEWLIWDERTQSAVCSCMGGFVYDDEYNTCVPLPVMGIYELMRLSNFREKIYDD